MRGDVLRAVVGPSCRVGNCQTQAVREHPRMVGVEDTAIGLLISLLVLYPPLKRSCYPSAPMLISKASSMLFFSLIHCLLLFPDAYRYVFSIRCSACFSFLVPHTQSLFVEWRIVLYTCVRKSAVS